MRFALLPALLLQTTLLMASEEPFDAFEDDLASEFEAEFAKSENANTFDPLSDYNRVMTGFNDTFYTKVVFPVARGYEDVVHEEARLSLSRFFDNLQFPIRFTNNLLQLKFQNSADELARFMVNSTLGVLGLYDPAKEWYGLEAHKEDFGQTLGHYGVGGGFHIVLPFFGPSNLRDTLSMVPDWYIDPTIHWDGRCHNLVDNYGEGVMVKSMYILNESSFEYPKYESLKKDAIDLYPFFKNIYEQSRQKAIEE